MNTLEKLIVAALFGCALCGLVGYLSGLKAGAAQLARCEARVHTLRARADQACRMLAQVTPDDDGVVLANRAALVIAINPDVELP